MKTLLLTLLIALPVHALQEGVGTPPENEGTATVGAHLKITHPLKDTAGMVMEPNGLIIYNAPTLGGFGGADEIQIGLVDLTKFEDAANPGVYLYHIAGNADLVGRDSCYKVSAYQTSVSGGKTIRLDSPISEAICGRASNTLAPVKSLAIQ